MAAILELLASWKRWLAVAVLRRRDPGEASAWLWAIRARILAFLVARYADPEARARAMEQDADIHARLKALEPPPPPPRPTPQPPTDDIFRIRLACNSSPAAPRVGPPQHPPPEPPQVAPVDAPPRAGRDLRRALIDIRASNTRNRRSVRRRCF